MAKLDVKVYDYESAKRALKGKQSRKIGHNTWVNDLGDNGVEFTLHGHPIVQYFTSTGSGFTVFIDDCGYPTPATRDRLRQLLPFRLGVFQRDHEQYFRVRHSDGQTKHVMGAGQSLRARYTETYDIVSPYRLRVRVAVYGSGDSNLPIETFVWHDIE